MSKRMGKNLKHIKKLGEMVKRVSSITAAGNAAVEEVNTKIREHIEGIENLQLDGKSITSYRDGQIKEIEQESQEFFNEVMRLWGRYMTKVEQEAHFRDAETIYNFLGFLTEEENIELPKYKVALVFICLNQLYWEFAPKAIEGAKRFFLPGHQVDYFLWSDMPLENNFGATVIPTEPVQWPMPTLMRYHLFLREEQRLAQYDYIFYCDIDMQWVDIVGDEILPPFETGGLTAVQHPMYALRKEYVPPYEPNSESTAYIPRPGRIIEETIEKDGTMVTQKRFEPLYFAGGFQGGRTVDFIRAMKEMRTQIDIDFAKNYVARWNDESHWNKYLFNNPPVVVLSPSYVYPDSLIEEYYLKVWGRNYNPRLVTLTKKFTLTEEGGKHVDQFLKTS